MAERKRRRVFDLDPADLVVRPNVNNFLFHPRGFLAGQFFQGKHNHLVSWLEKPGRAAIELNFAPDTRNGISFPVNGVGHAVDMDKLEGHDPRRIHQLAVDRDATLIIESRSGDPDTMQLPGANGNGHGTNIVVQPLGLSIHLLSS